MKKKAKLIKGYGGLGYVILKNLPTRVSKDKTIGTIIDLEPREIEKQIALELINQRIPIRGTEVEFLRKCLKLSMEKFAGQLGLTGASILKWEREPKKRLARINEFAVRALVAEHLGISPVRISDLLDLASSPGEVIVDFAIALTMKKSA
jgi:DNA-binding transcriptional regulator YiaG